MHKKSRLKGNCSTIVGLGTSEMVFCAYDQKTYSVQKKIGSILQYVLQVHRLSFDELKACWVSFLNYTEMTSFITGC